MKTVLLSLMLCLLWPVMGYADGNSVYITSPTSVVITTQDGESHKFLSEIAITEQQQKQGLSGRAELDDDKGMLFVFQHDRMVAMWMKDTFIPLDMLFIDKTGRILMIHENATPMSEAMIYGSEPVRAVLEINGGQAAKLGIEPGDRLEYPRFY